MKAIGFDKLLLCCSSVGVACDPGVSAPGFVKLIPHLLSHQLEQPMATYSPPFTLTHAMLSRVADIAELVGQWRFAQSSQVPMLRRENRLRTIQAPLVIEHVVVTSDSYTTRNSSYLLTFVIPVPFR